MVDLQKLRQELNGLDKARLVELALPQAVRLRKAGKDLADYRYGGSRRSGLEARVLRAFEAVLLASGHQKPRLSSLDEARATAKEHGLEAVLEAIAQKAGLENDE